jgi:hypothetical protein
VLAVTNIDDKMAIFKRKIDQVAALLRAQNFHQTHAGEIFFKKVGSSVVTKNIFCVYLLTAYPPKKEGLCLID